MKLCLEGGTIRVMAMRVGLAMLSILLSLEGRADTSFLDNAKSAIKNHQPEKAVLEIKKFFESKPGDKKVEVAIHQLESAFSLSKDGSIMVAPIVSDDLSFLKVSGRRMYFTSNDMEKSFLRIVGFYRLGSMVESVVIRKGDGTPLFTETRKTELTNWGTEKKPGFHLSVPIPPPGLYAIEIKFKSKAKVGTWFILGNHGPSRTPRISYPPANSIIEEKQPMIRWDTFQTPEFKGFEKRKIFFSVSKEAESSQSETVFEDFLDGGTTSFKVEKLTTGKYTIHMTYQEIKTLNGIDLMRESAVFHVFSVK